MSVRIESTERVHDVGFHLRQVVVLCLTVGSVGLLAGLVWMLFASLNAPVQKETLLAGFATNLSRRTPSQRINAIKSAQRIHGTILAPDAVFSFNRIGKSWSFDQGYVKAPVSYDGAMILAYGGGVCQTSTTLYNAALLAGLPILERHAHVFAPNYVPPGRDAAVAQETIDLKFRNPYPFPIRIAATAKGDVLDVRIYGSGKPYPSEVETEILSFVEPKQILVAPSKFKGVGAQQNEGTPGFRVVMYRTITYPSGESRRERLSGNIYKHKDSRVVSSVATERERRAP